MKPSSAVTTRTSRPSLALFVALGGSSYAALTLPRNSVGPRRSAVAVGSSELRDLAPQHGHQPSARVAARGAR